MILTFQGQDLIVMFIKVLNYNSQVSNAQLITQEKEDSNFWILVSEGSIGTDNVTVEVDEFLKIVFYYKIFCYR